MNFRSSGHLYTPTAIIILASLVGSVIWHSFLTEWRWSRDLLALTPFHSVHIDTVRIRGDTMTVTGSLVKRRCERTGVVSYTRSGDVLSLAIFAATGEAPGTPPNRPVSHHAQAFGPWTITALSPVPEAALLFVYHTCPEGRQSNLVFDLPWEDRG